MKGQNAVFEQVLLFAIAVAMFVIAFGIFQMYQNYYSSTALIDHTRSIRDMINNHILELTRMEELNASLTLGIPEELSGEYYLIKINNTELRVTTDVSGVTSASSLAALWVSGYEFFGETRSSRGEIIIYKRGYNIIIG
jgi:hypothetical protein